MLLLAPKWKIQPRWVQMPLLWVASHLTRTITYLRNKYLSCSLSSPWACCENNRRVAKFHPAVSWSLQETFQRINQSIRLSKIWTRFANSSNNLRCLLVEGLNTESTRVLHTRQSRTVWQETLITSSRRRRRAWRRLSSWGMHQTSLRLIDNKSIPVIRRRWPQSQIKRQSSSYYWTKRNNRPACLRRQEIHSFRT